MNYDYLLANLILLIVWAIFYNRSPSIRKQMLVWGIIMGILGTIYEFVFFTRDWWQPQTITGTRIGIEDFLHGFVVMGLSFSLYKVLFRKKYAVLEKINFKKAVSLLLINASVTSIVFFVFHAKSFYATFAGLIVSILYILISRKDLIVFSIATGVLLMIVMIPGYLFIGFIDPGFIDRWWIIGNLTHVTFIGIPIEDLLFYFFSGMALGPFLDFIYE